MISQETFSRLPVSDVCFIPASGEHSTERGELLSPLQTALTITGVRNPETVPGAWSAVFQSASREKSQTLEAPGWEGGASPFRLLGPYFSSALGDKSMLYSLLVINLHHRTCKFCSCDKLFSFAGKFLSFEPKLLRDVLVSLKESCGVCTICSKQGALWWLTVGGKVGHWGKSLALIGHSSWQLRLRRGRGAGKQLCNKERWWWCVYLGRWYFIYLKISQLLIW